MKSLILGMIFGLVLGWWVLSYEGSELGKRISDQIKKVHRCR